MAIGVLPPLLVTIKAEFRLSTVQVGAINSVFGLARMMIDLPTGRYLRRTGSVVALVTAILLAITGSLVIGLAGRYPVVLAGRALVGFGTGIAYVVIMTLLFRECPRRVRGRVTGLYESARTLSLGVASLGAGYLGPALGWRGVFLGAALVAVLALGLAVLWAVRATPLGVPAGLGPLGPGPGLTTAGNPAAAPGSSRLGSPRLLPIYGISFLLAFCWGGVFVTLFPLYGGTTLQLTSEVVGWALTLGAFANVLLLFPLGWWSDHIGRIPILGGGVGVLAVAVFLIPHSTGPALFLGLGALLGAGFSIWAQPPAILVERSTGLDTSTIVGSYRFANDVGYVTGPLVLGFWPLDWDRRCRFG